MTKEQEEAIERLKRIDIRFFLSGMNEQNNYIVDEADKVNKAIETVLNLLEKKDKIIDLMADFFNKRSWKEHQIKDEICLCCTTEFGDEDCKDCIKQYFENQAKM